MSILSWLKSYKDAELYVDGYKLFHGDRIRRKKCKRGRLNGGVTAYIHNDLANQMEVKLKFSKGGVEVLGLYSSAENLFLAIVYRQPDDVSGRHHSTVNELKPAIDKLQKTLEITPSMTQMATSVVLL